MNRFLEVDLNFPLKESYTHLFKNFFESYRAGILILKPIRNHKNVVFDYIIQHYNQLLKSSIEKIFRVHIQHGSLFFEIFPSFKKNPIIYKLEKRLNKHQSFSVLDYFGTDGLDHWLQIDGYLLETEEIFLIVYDKTLTIKEKSWQEAHLLASSELLKNHYWKLAIPKILKKLYKVSSSHRVNLYLNEDPNHPDQFLIIDSYFDYNIDKETEKHRDKIGIHDFSQKIQEDLLRQSKILDLKHPFQEIPKFQNKNIYRSVLVPIFIKDTLSGFIEFENPKGTFLYSREKKILSQIARNFSIAIIRRMVRKQIEESSIYYKTIIETLNSVIYKAKLYPPFQITYLSPNSNKILNIDSQEILNNPNLFNQKISTENLNSLNLAVQKLKDFQSPFEFEIQYHNDSIQKNLTLLITGNVLLNEFGNPSEIIGIIHDITNQKTKEKEKWEWMQSQLIARLTSTIAHDINNKIQPALIYLSIIKDHFQNESKYQDMVPKIENATNSLIQARNLIKKLLDFSKDQLSSSPVSPSQFKPFLISYIQDFKKLHNISIHANDLDSIPDSFTLPIDSSLLTQMFDAILMNSLEARNSSLSTENIPLKISIQPRMEDSYLCIQIIDNAGGIDPSLIQMAIEPFVTTKTNHHGLGLSFVQSILKKIHGKLTIQNVDILGEKGTMVTLYFPIQ